MFGIGSSELLIVLIVALLVFGPARLPEIGKKLGEAAREFRKMMDQITNPDTSETKKGNEEHAADSIHRDS